MERWNIYLAEGKWEAETILRMDEVEFGKSMGDPGGFIIVRIGSGNEVGLHFRDLGSRMNRTINQPLAAEPLKSGHSNLSFLKCGGNS